MKNKGDSADWRIYGGCALVGLGLAAGAAVLTGMWVLTALPIGFLFGFFLQKGDLCGASAFSEVVLMKDGRKVFGLWVAIVVSMLGFALLDVVGLVKLNPKPMIWLNHLVGGMVFGIGMVLAGGCVSGCLFKAGTGNINSMAALPGIALGVALVHSGPLGKLNAHLKTFKVFDPQGGAVSLSSLTGLSFWVLALILAALTMAAAVFVRRRRGKKGSKESTEPIGKKVLARPWKPWQSGVAVGLLGAVAYLSSAASGRNYPLGVTGGVAQVGVLATQRNVRHVWKKKHAGKKPAARLKPGRKKRAKGGKVVWWLVILVSSMVVGSWVSGRMSGEARLLPKPPGQTITAFAGGILVGVGAGFAKGCVVGNILSGIGLMSVGVLLFAAVTVLANWATTYFYLMGGGLFGSKTD